jgi:N-methylhydantoinase A
MSGGVLIGADVGGTFTDIFVHDETSGRSAVAKVPTTKDNQAEGLIEGIGQVAELREVGAIVHGTTVGTNALLERRGARCGVITTAGFRDVLEMRRRDRPRTWGLWGQFLPIVPRDLRLEVDERVLADGTVALPVDQDQVRAAADKLRAAGCDAVVVIFINAYANPANEALAVGLVRQLWPNGFVGCSSEILPEIREFERASTTALNGYLQPVVSRYLSHLEQELTTRRFAGPLLIVQSNGGIMTAATARAFPVRTALSGPAAGVIAAAEIARAAGFANVVSCDMGGTSFDVSLVADGRSVLAPQTTIDFGLVIRTPMIEITTIGAGGGSIAWVDRGGLLQIGPESAGSDPGPACYGQGNDRPTVTDANLATSRIDGDRPIGGKLARLDVAAARTAIQRHVGVPLGLSVEIAAEAVIEVANAKMAQAIRLVSIERGHDPRRFVAMPFGGSGGLHVGALMNEVGLAKAVVPRFPGVTSAMGCIMADIRHDHVQTVNLDLAWLDGAALAARMNEHAAAARAVVERSGAAAAATEARFELDMIYQGQTHSLAVPIAASPVDEASVRQAFEACYRRTYGQLLPGIAVRIVSLRTTVIGRRPKLDLTSLAPGADASMASAARGERDVWIGGAWRTARVFDRLSLPVGAVVDGPAILEQPDSTIFLEPALRGTVDRFGNLVIERGSRG